MALLKTTVHSLKIKLSSYHYAALIMATVLFLAVPPDFATAQNTYRLSKAPHVKTVKKGSIPVASKIVFSGVELHPDMKEEFFYQGREEVFQPILDHFEVYLDSLEWLYRMEDETLNSSGAPYVYAGSAEGETAPPHAHLLREDHEEYPPMVLHVNKSSKQWKKNYTEKLTASNADYMILIWVGFSEYPKADKGLFKKKVVLGTGYEREIRFLSAIDKPVEVLQLTGVILNKKGDVMKAGAEVFLHQDTPFWAQVFDMGKAIDDETLQNVILEEKREDLTGQPPAWQVAIYHLMQNLTERPADYRL